VTQDCGPGNGSRRRQDAVPDVVPPTRSRTGWSASRRFDVPTEQPSRGPAVMRPPWRPGPPSWPARRACGSRCPAPNRKCRRRRRQTRSCSAAVAREDERPSREDRDCGNPVLTGFPGGARGRRRTVRRPRWLAISRRSTGERGRHDRAGANDGEVGKHDPTHSVRCVVGAPGQLAAHRPLGSCGFDLAVTSQGRRFCLEPGADTAEVPRAAAPVLTRR